MHVEAAAVIEKVPAWHAEQFLGSVAPTPVENEPMAHAMHAVVAFIPVPVEYRPAPHWTHAETAAVTEKDPAWHLEQFLGSAAPTPVKNVPVGQAVQPVIPTPVEYPPALHWMHVEAADARTVTEYMPASHPVQLPGSIAPTMVE